MPRLPRDCDYKKLLQVLKRYDYSINHTTGSHIRLHSEKYNHSLTIPAHKPIKVGTLNAILNEICSVTDIDKAALINKLQ
ncbi:MAG: type II toxin-antitoxin system HicA family toxin [Spirochaetales bacterium]|nr:type II toxin-antitoxin system HicA family toxin [Spirochaetales bacterium]